MSIYLSTFFFVSFVLVNAFILFNVFVAVLLDKVVSPDKDLTDELDSFNEVSADGSPLPQQHGGATSSPTGPSGGERVASPSEGSPPMNRKSTADPPVNRKSAADGGSGSPQPKLSASKMLEKLLQMQQAMHEDVRAAVSGQEELHERLGEAMQRLARLERAMGIEEEEAEEAEEGRRSATAPPAHHDDARS